MTPDQISKSGTEHSHQVALFAWAAIATWHGFKSANLWAETGVINQSPTLGVKPLKWLHAVHNQGHGDAIHGARAKAEGVRAGIPDIFLPYPKGMLHGLYIEMKKPGSRPVRETSKGGLSDEQIEFAKYAKTNNYAWEVCYGWKEAAKIIEFYFL